MKVYNKKLKESYERRKKRILKKNLNYLKPIPENLEEFITFKNSTFIGHRNVELFFKKLKDGEKSIIISGFNPSGPTHIGHLPLFLTIKYLQKKYNLNVLIPISDDESYFKFSNVESQYLALKNSFDICKEIISWGFNNKKTIFLINQLYPQIYVHAMGLSPFISVKEIVKRFDYPFELNIGKFFYPAVQISHILFPTLKEGGSYRNILVMAGLDEIGHFLILSDIINGTDDVNISELYCRLYRGLDGKKMSTSEPENCIFLKENRSSIKNKIDKVKRIPLELINYIKLFEENNGKKYKGSIKDNLLNGLIDFRRKIKKISVKECAILKAGNKSYLNNLNLRFS